MSPLSKIIAIIILCITGLAWSHSPLPFQRVTLAEAAGPSIRQDGVADKRFSEQERRLEREKRLIRLTSDDLRGLLSSTQNEIAELERDIDGITLLESSVIETDFRDFIDWYYGFNDWMKEMLAEFDGDLALLFSGRARLNNRCPKCYADMSGTFKKFAKKVAEDAKRYETEGNRLAKIIDRRILLQSRMGDMEERLVHIENQLAGRVRENGRDNKDADRLRISIRAVQSEILTLPLVNEEILKHYMNLSERARGEAEWLLVKSDEYNLLRDIAGVVSGSEVKSEISINTALERMHRTYEREIERLQRRIEAIERKRSRVAPAGLLHEVQRSAELNNLYDDQKRKYEDYIRHLKIQTGVWEAEFSELGER